MSFSISLGGTAAEALTSLENYTPPVDASQYDKVVSFLREHINTFPSTGLVSVSASGHHDGANATLQLNIGYSQPQTPAPVDTPAG